MIITYEKLVKSYQDLIRSNIYHIGEGLIMTRDSEVLHKFTNINDITIDIIKGLSIDKGEIVFVYPCNLREKNTTLDICVESYIIRNNNYEQILESIHGCQCVKRHINMLKDLDLRSTHLL